MPAFTTEAPVYAAEAMCEPWSCVPWEWESSFPAENAWDSRGDVASSGARGPHAARRQRQRLDDNSFEMALMRGTSVSFKADRSG